jgi:hypothetical protein
LHVNNIFQGKSKSAKILKKLLFKAAGIAEGRSWLAQHGVLPTLA